MNVSITGPRIYFTIPILGGIPITETIVNSLLVTLFILGMCIFLTRDLKVRAVSKRQVVAEFLVETAQNFVNGNMGVRFSYYGPFVAALFASSILGSLLSLLGLFPPTSDLSTTGAWALMVFVLITYNKIRSGGLGGYLLGFTQPIPVLTPFNVLSELATPISMAFRHFGNLAGGGVITSVLYMGLSMASTAVLNLIAANGWLVSAVLMAAGVGLLLLRRKKKKLSLLIFGCLSLGLGFFGLLQTIGVLSGVPVLALGIPAVLSCYFDIFSGAVQALVFSLLSMVYIAGSCPDPNEA